MRLAWITDPHLDFVAHRPVAYDALLDQIHTSGAEALLLSGDIGEAHSVEHHLVRLQREAALPCYFVLGNHDYYGGSVAAVRRLARAIDARDSPRLRYVHGSAPLPLGDDALLIGVDGWGDGRLGDARSSRVVLNDFHRIQELREAVERGALLDELAERGDAEAAALAPVLADALARRPTVLVLTHVPPFRGAAWHEGAVSADDWLPYFSCGATGEVLATQAAAHPDARVSVLCGHTHGGGFVAIADNLHVHTGPARYGVPEVAGIVTVDASGVHVERTSRHWADATT